MKRGFACFAIFLILCSSSVFAATPYSPSSGYHPLQQVTTDQTGTTSVDANSNGIIDTADSTGTFTGDSIGSGTTDVTFKIKGGTNLWSAIDFYNGAGAYWGMGKDKLSGDGDFYIDKVGGRRALTIDRTTLNVGLDTTNPQAKLDVNGDVKIGGDTGTSRTNNLLKIAGDSSTSGIQLYADDYFDDNTWGTRLWKDHHGNGIGLRVDTQYTSTWYPSIYIGHGQQAADPFFGVFGGATIGSGYTQVNSPPANGLIVEGNVGIGDSTPANKLDVAGAIGISDVAVIDAARNWVGNVIGVSKTTAQDTTDDSVVGTVDSSEITDGAVTSADILDGTITGADILNGAVVLGTDTSGAYIASESDPLAKTFAKTALPSCTAGQVLKGDGTSLSCVADQGITSESDPKVAGGTANYLTKWASATSLGNSGIIDDGSNVYLPARRVAFNGGSITTGGAYGIGNGAAYYNPNSIAVDTLETDGGYGGGGTLELNYYGGNEVHIGPSGSKPLRASILYDGSSGYYADPNSNSRMAAIYSDNDYTYGWFRNLGGRVGLYSENYGTHLYWDSASYLDLSTNYGMRFRSSSVYDSAIAGYVYHDSTGFGMLSNRGSWMFYSPANSENVYFPAWGNWISSAATHRAEGTNFVDYSRYVYNNGAYSGSGWVEPSSLGVYYAYLGRLVYNNGAYSGSGWVEPSDLGVRYALNANGAYYATVINTDSYWMKLHWSGQGGQPTWLWGSNNGVDAYVWNPSNFNVNYANSAGSASSATYGRYVYNNGAYSGSGWVEPSDLGVRYALNANGAYYATVINTDSYWMKLHWSGQGGQPTWLWGSNNGVDAYVWNPSNFNVNYANSAGYATNAGYASRAGSSVGETVFSNWADAMNVMTYYDGYTSSYWIGTIYDLDNYDYTCNIAMAANFRGLATCSMGTYYNGDGNRYIGITIHYSQGSWYYWMYSNSFTYYGQWLVITRRAR